MTGRDGRVGVVLFQLGGPDNLEAIEPFLYNLFCDPDIIDFPFANIGRKALAKLISSTRAKKVQSHYASIGGGSPIRKFTELQAWALESNLRSLGLDAHCFVAMRYWHPFTQEAVDNINRLDCDQIVLLPLYPQYSQTTTGSSLREWSRRFNVADCAIHTVAEFYENSSYLDSVIDKIHRSLANFPVAHPPEIIFSAHSVPLAIIERGDPYQRQVQRTVELVMSRGEFSNRHHLCYQSKVGASKWLQPSLHQTLRNLAKDGVTSVCVVPIAFVSDHVETLAEISHEARDAAAQLGIAQFEMTAGLNDCPLFINALAQLVLQKIGFTPWTPQSRLVEAGCAV